MIIVGCDYHPSFQQIAFVDTDTGERASADWSIVRQPRGSIVSSRPRE